MVDTSDVDRARSDLERELAEGCPENPVGVKGEASHGGLKPGQVIRRVVDLDWRSTLTTEVVAIGCGGRYWTPQGADLRVIAACLREHRVTVLRHGASGELNKLGQPQCGADLWLAQLATDHGLDVHAHPVSTHERKKQGTSAEPRRNTRMLDTEPRPSLVIALPGGRGTLNMVNQARKAGVQVVWPLGQMEMWR